MKLSFQQNIEKNLKKSSFALSSTIDRFCIYHRKRRSKRRATATQRSDGIDVKSRLQDIYGIWNGEFFQKKLKVILSICQSLYIIRHLVDDLWKFSKGAHMAKDNENKLKEQEMLKKRSQVVREIYQTEEIYTNDIEILVNVRFSIEI